MHPAAAALVLSGQFERRQHREQKEANKHLAACDYYGAEHLLRLFVRLPELLARCQMQREHMTVLVSKLSELLKFIVQQKAKYLAAEYNQPGEDYLVWWSSNNHGE